MSAIEIRRIAAVEDYRSIRLAGLKEAPNAFGSTYEREIVWPLGEFAQRLDGTVVFGAYAGDEIVGMVGFKQETGPKDRHKGYVWGMYVKPEARRSGAGAALIAALLEHARAIVEQLTLTVTQGNDAAVALYRKFGFETYGVEPKSLKSASGYSDEVLMVRFFEAG